MAFMAVLSVYSVFRIVERVLTYRNDASRPLLNMLAFQMDAKPGERDGEATLMATVLLTGIERMATVLTNPHLRQAGLMQTGTSHDVHVSGLLEAEFYDGSRELYLIAVKDSTTERLVVLTALAGPR